MQAIVYFLALPFIYLVSLLPFPLFYLFSDFIFFIMYHVLGYRKKVVYTNLKNSFPEKSEEEIRKIMRKFYRYLCDLFLETFKTLTISRKAMLRRCKMTENGAAVFDRLFEQKRNAIIVMGHFGNWEWAGNTFSLTRRHQLYVIYHPLKNKYFNQLIIDMRMRFGTKLIRMKDTMRDMLANRKGEPNVTAFIADQTPRPENCHWMTFLNQDTPVFLGTERFAMKLDYPVIYVSVKRLKRGHYSIDAEMLVEHPEETKENGITELHTRRLEKDIREQPEIWLWSHRRWKHLRPDSSTGTMS